MRAVRAVAAGILSLAVAGGAAWIAAADQATPSPQAAKEIREAQALVASRKLDEAIPKLRGLIARFPDDPAAQTARVLLRENGVGDEVRIAFIEREYFRAKLKMEEVTVLELEEEILKTLREKFREVKPQYTQHQLRATLFESQARYRQAGGLANSGGHFGVISYDPGARSLAGKIEWFFPREYNLPPDRQLAMKALLHHESVHYLDAIHFGRRLPAPLDEGLATWITCQLCTESYQHYRTTEKGRIETHARNALGAIKDFPGFLRLLDGGRGFGQGNDVMINRWYGLCYSMIDFFVHGEIGGKQIGEKNLLLLFQKLLLSPAGGAGEAGASAGGAAGNESEKKSGRKSGGGAKGDKSRKPAEATGSGAKDFLEKLVREAYGVPLEDFHRELQKHILARFKQG